MASEDAASSARVVEDRLARLRRLGGGLSAFVRASGAALRAHVPRCDLAAAGGTAAARAHFISAALTACARARCYSGARRSASSRDRGARPASRSTSPVVTSKPPLAHMSWMLRMASTTNRGSPAAASPSRYGSTLTAAKPRLLPVTFATSAAVQVQAEFGSRIVDLAAEGFDVALRGDTGRQQDMSLTARRLIQRNELSLYAAPGYLARRGSPRALGSPEHDWLVAGPLRRAFDFPAAFTPRIVANDFLFLRGVAASGGGIATLPGFIAQPWVASGELVRVLPSIRVNAGGLVLLYSSTRPLARKVAAFRDFMVDITQREWVG